MEQLDKVTEDTDKDKQHGQRQQMEVYKRMDM